MTDGWDYEFIEKYNLNVTKLGHYQTYPCFLPNTGTQLTSFITGNQQDMTVVKFDGSGRKNLTPPFIWDKINVSQGWMNLPFMYPTPEVKGWIVSGVDTPVGLSYTHPRDLWLDLDGMDYIVHPEINRNVPRYGWLPWDRGDVWTRSVSRQKWIKTFTKRLECFKWLAKNKPVDFALLGVTFTDGIYSTNKDTIELGDMSNFEKDYRFVDAELTKLIDELKPGKVICFSDHGDWVVHRSPAYFASNFKPSFEIKDITDIHKLIVEVANE